MSNPFDTPYDRPASEIASRKFWQQNKVYSFEHASTKPIFSIDTPPPYVSADHLHAGHIMSYGQADFIARFKRMQGFNVFYPMGFDDNGLPTERFVEKKYNVDKAHSSREEFIKLCLKETEQGAKTYRDLWEKLGISVDWSRTYSTINPVATKVSQWSLIDLYRKGALYRDTLPVLWCTHCETALAQADLEDKEENGKLYHVLFTSESGQALPIATTRPELIPACVALYAHPNDQRYAELIGTKALVPLLNYSVPILSSDEVLMEFGTGLMMVSTWGDKEDVMKWQKNQLTTRAIIEPNGILNQLASPYQELKLNAARTKIVEDLHTAKLLTKEEDIVHTKQVHERCSTAVEFILSKQWFIRIKDKKSTWLEYGKKIAWHPASRYNDYQVWVESLQWDWCISRQRFYGVPLPIWYCKQCQEPKFASEDQLPVDPSNTKPHSPCQNCSFTEFYPELDVADTWATSSCTPFLLAALSSDSKEKIPPLPISVRPNAFEIIRTWDLYSIVKSYYHFGDIPFENIMVSGHGLDQQGRKISKRLGNYTPSDKLIAEHGADSIRYWATGARLGQNLRFNIEEINKGKKTIMKLWNVAKFFSLYPTTKPAHEIPNLEAMDIWILTELNSTIAATTKSFESYEYAKAREAISNFFWSQLADYYIEFIKYRLNGDDNTSKQAAQSTLGTVLQTVLKLFAPILPYITEEIYQHLFSLTPKESIHLSIWPQLVSLPPESALDDFSSAIAAIDEIRKHKSKNALSLGTSLPTYELTQSVDLKKYGHFIQQVMRVSNLTIKE